MSFTVCENNSSSVAVGCGGGGGGAFTVTRAVACCVPPGPLAVNVEVVDSAGVTDCEPLGGTAPTPSMLTSVALLVSQVSVGDSPFSTGSGCPLTHTVCA